MNETHRERLNQLADALESGNFPQAKGALRTEDGFCCLGVACELYRQATGMGQWAYPHYSVDMVPRRYIFNLNGYEHANYLPPQVADWYGLTEGNPVLPIDIEVWQAFARQHPEAVTGLCWAATLNDEGMSFTDIAQGFRRLALQ
jgi:hypothetical protein